jgi:hypothetical protein
MKKSLIYEKNAFNNSILGSNNLNKEKINTQNSTIINNIYYVDATKGNNANTGSKSNPFLTIQYAIDLAKNGDTIILERGQYFEAIDLKGKIALLTSNYYITGDTADINNTIISGKNNGNKVLVSNTIDCYNTTNYTTIDGLTLTDTRLRALFLRTPSCGQKMNYSLKHSVIKNSGRYGNDALIVAGANSLMDSCIINDNKGSHIILTDKNATPAYIKNCIFYNNAASDNGSSYEQESVLAVEGKQYIINNLFFRNKATAISFGLNGSDSAILVNNTVTMNSGYGLHFWTISGSYGGFLINNISAFNGHFDITANNVLNGPDYYLRNNLFGKKGLMLETNLLSENNTLLDTIGNFGGDPYFRDTLNNDFRLLSYSPAIAAGSLTNYLLPKDLIGNTRINAYRKVPDIGVYESSFKFPAPILFKSESTNRKVKLFWTQKNSDFIKAYKIYRSIDSIPDNFNGKEIAIVNDGNIFNYTDSANDLINGSKYFYRTRAINKDNSESDLGKQIYGIPDIELKIVPLKFISFVAKRMGKDIPITWKVAEVVNIVGFDLERSFDGNNFSFLNNKTVGNASEFTFKDNHPQKAWYRVKVNEADGSSWYSWIESVNALPLNVNIYPNPTTSKINILYKANEAGIKMIKLIDIQGKTMLTKSINTQIGNNNISIDISSLSNGTYMLVGLSENGNIIIKQ